MKNRLLPLILALLLSPLTGLDAGTTGILEGYVRNQETGAPLHGVNVIIVGTRLGTSTNADGFFRIHNIPAGTYSVTFRMIGFTHLTVNKVVIQTDLKTSLSDITLMETSVETEGVVIEAVRPLIQKDITGSTIRVAEKRIAHMPVNTVTEILSVQTGVTDEGNVRGGKSSEVQFLIDGMPVKDMMTGKTDLYLPRNAVTQMGIHTGGFNSQYGNALSGIVNIITKSGSNTPVSDIQVESDGYPGFTQQSMSRRLEATAGGALARDRVYYFLAADLHHSSGRWWQDFEAANEQGADFTFPLSRSYSGFAKLDAHINPEHRFSTQVLFTDHAWRDYEFSWRYNLDGLPARRTRVFRWAAVWSHFLSKNTFYSLDVSYNMLQNRINDRPKDELTFEPWEYDFYLQYIISGTRSWWADTRQGILTLKGDLSSQIADLHFIKMGFQTQLFDIHGDIIKYEPQTTYFGKPLIDEPMLNFSTTYDYYPRMGSLYLQDRIELTKAGGVINIGLRYDFLDPRAKRPSIELVPVSEDEYTSEISGWTKASLKQSLNPRFGISIPLTEKSFIFGNLGWYTQFPLFHQLYAGIDNVTLRSGMNVLRGNPDLKAETNTTAEMSYKQYMAYNTVFSLTWFSKHTKNQIDAKTFIPSNNRISGDYGFAEYVNNDRADATGFELALTRERGEFITGSLSYVYMKADGLSSSADHGIFIYQWGFEPITSLHPLSWDQRHTLKATIFLEFPWGFDAAIMWQYHSPRPYTYYPSSDGYTPDYPDLAFIPNNERMSDYNLTNIRLTQNVSTGLPFVKEASVYLDIRNLFNRQNVVWMDASGRIGGELGDPGAWGIGRRTHLGVRITF
ncbi:TonB-dependent receptor [bacterium]|nr:TonB-dependent receptor [bacterium]